MIEFAILFVAFYVWHALGITIGYHRGLSHRAFSCSKWVEYFWVLPGYLAFEGSPIWWSVMHRAHHRHVDTPLDPHSPRFGVEYAHLGWLAKMNYPEHIDPKAQAKDLVSDPLYAFLEQGGSWRRAHTLSYALNLIFRGVILLAFGWVPALASLLAGLAVQQIPLMLNVICHLPKFGYKTYAGHDDSVNVWWVGLLAMGEGWHNNHHAAPGSARSGMRWFELDVTYWVLVAMKKIGLLTRMNVVSHERLMELSTRTMTEQDATEAAKPLSGTVSNPLAGAISDKISGRISGTISTMSDVFSEVTTELAEVTAEAKLAVAKSKKSLVRAS